MPTRPADRRFTRGLSPSITRGTAFIGACDSFYMPGRLNSAALFGPVVSPGSQHGLVGGLETESPAVIYAVPRLSDWGQTPGVVTPCQCLGN